LVPCVSNAFDLIGDVEVLIPHLHAPSPQQPSAAAASLADRDEEVPLLVFHPVLLWFRVIVMMTLLFQALCLIVFLLLPVPLFALDLPCRLVAVADALLGMVTIDLLLRPVDLN
jgi:hypothetical protein